MTTCLMDPIAVSPVPSPRATHCCGVKRLRAHSEGDVAKLERLLKTHKQLATDSPCSVADLRSNANATTTSTDAASEPTLISTPLPALLPTPRPRASWPVVTSCESIKYSLAFLQDSRMHAMALLAQDEWQRAMTVLEKVERANDMVARQRRRMVLQQANVPSASEEMEVDCRPRRVRFSDAEASVIAADDCDRSPVRVPLLVREEILILRASRSIPAENFSEFWN